MSWKQAEALQIALHDPATHTQRAFEEISFLDIGGQCCRRHLQLLLPTSHSSDDDHAEQLFVASLGMFERKRFTDFTVHDGGGKRVNLVTRLQHGEALAKAHLRRYVDYLPTEPFPALEQLFATLYHKTYTMFTSVENPDTEQQVAQDAADDLRGLLRASSFPAEDIDREVEAFIAGFVQLSAVTQYLCWVRGIAGQLVNLTVSYSMKDPSRPRSRRPLASEVASKYEADLLKDAEAKDAGMRASNNWRVARTKIYSRFGFGPIHYEKYAVVQRHVGSYYFAIEPPRDSRVMYMDWGSSHSFTGAEAEWDCARESVHKHSGSVLSIGGGISDSGEDGEVSTQAVAEDTIHAYVRPDPVDRTQIVVGALVNLLFAYLAGHDSLGTQLSGTASILLVLAPAALIAYGVQHQSHYYADRYVWLRGIAISYLLLNVVFLAALVFNASEDNAILPNPGATEDVIFGVMAIASVAVVILFTAIGGVYDRLVRQRHRRRCRVYAPAGASHFMTSAEAMSTHDHFVTCLRWYADCVTVVVVLACVTTGVAMA